MSKISDLIQQNQEITAAGYTSFDEDYSRRYPLPASNNRLLFIGMSVGLFFALVLSGQLTIPSYMRVLAAAGQPLPLQLIGGFSGFIAVDLVMFMATFSLITARYKPQAQRGEINFDSLMTGLQIAAVFGFIVGVSSNLFFVLVGYDVVSLQSSGGQSLSFFVGVLLAFAPPVQASATASIMALIPLTSLVEGQAYDKTKRAAWTRYAKSNGYALDIKAVTDSYIKAATARLEQLPTVSNSFENSPTQKTVSNSLEQSQAVSKLTIKGALRLLAQDESKYKQAAQTVLNSNPSANKRAIAEAISLAMIGNTSGYATVQRAYKELGQDLS